MAKQHEKLAVKASVLGKFQALIKEAADTFTSKHHLFTNKMLEFTSDKEGSSPVIEEQGKLQYTVGQKFDYLSPSIANLLDVCNQINETNTVARADIIVNGKTLLTGVCAQTLLELEKYLLQIKAMVQTAPTLDPAKGFVPDANQGAGVYKAREITRPRTAKEKVVLTLSPATDKFQAQVQVYDKDVQIGITRQNEWSGMLTPAEKAARLDKIEDLINAVKEACSRANSTDVIGEKIGKTIMTEIFG